MAIENKKSIQLNMFLNMLRGLLGAIFPLITFPYVTRALGVDGIGMFNFANSVVSYFVLIAGLGINTYAIREGASLREDREKLERFFAEIFTISVISSVISYVLLFLAVAIIPQLHNYRALILMLSCQIAFKTIGVEWLYTIYEEYAYITVRTIICQFLSLILIFLFVRKSTDVVMYAVATVMATVGANLFNFIHAKRYCRISLTKIVNFKKHLGPVFILFATAATVTIYVNSDSTILGLICSDHEVGIYSVSVKIYTLLKTVLSSAIVVSIPRMSKYASEGRANDFAKLGSKIYKTFITFIFPSIFGIIVLRKPIVLFLSGSDYITATSSLIILCIALFFCLGAGFWSQAVMIPLNMENKVFFITGTSAILNIGLNIILIPLWKENAAAFTTVISEGIVFAYCWYQIRGKVDMKGSLPLFLKAFLGSVPMIIIAYLVKTYFINIFAILVLTIFSCIIEYGVIEFLLKNEIVVEYTTSILKSINRNFKVK